MAAPKLPNPDRADETRRDLLRQRALMQFEAAQAELARLNPDLSAEDWERIAAKIAEDVDQALRDRFGGAESNQSGVR